MNTDTSGVQPRRYRLTAGSLSVILEEGKLRYLKIGEHEVLRGIYAAVRDVNWGTPPGILSDLAIDQHPDSFRVTFTSTHQQGDIHYVWRGTIEGTPSTISYDFDGEALSTFQRNRLGFCVLHPVTAAGVPVTLEHTDGTTERAHFPVSISPHQPFLNLRALTHQVAPDLLAEVRFEGDTFETEDQRQWTDASFKTYCTPLSIPYPVTVEKGSRLHQRISVTLQGGALPQAPAAPPSPTVSFIQRDQTFALPKIGFAASHGALTAHEVQKIAALRPSHIRVRMRIAHGEASLDGLEQAEALHTPLEIAFRVADAEGDTAAARAWAQEHNPNIARWLVFSADGVKTTPEIAQAAAKNLREFAPVYGGTDHFFTELNRNRPEMEWLDGVCFSVNPQVHAFDNASLIEALATLKTIVENAKVISGGKPAAVSPVTFKIRDNPNATTANAPDADGLPETVDVRQMSKFGAGWTLGALKYLTLGGADSVTFFETTGWLGIMERESGSPLPEQFPSLPGMVFPMYDIFMRAASFTHLSPLETDDPLRLEGVVFKKNGDAARLVANLTHEALHVNGAFDLQPYEIRDT